MDLNYNFSLLPLNVIPEGEVPKGDSNPEPAGFLALSRKEFKKRASQEVKMEVSLLSREDKQEKPLH